MDIKELQNKVIEFRYKREWAQYHNPKDLAISLSLEAAELLETFQWKDAGAVQAGRSDEGIRRRGKEEPTNSTLSPPTLSSTSFKSMMKSIPLKW